MMLQYTVGVSNHSFRGNLHSLSFNGIIKHSINFLTMFFLNRYTIQKLELEQAQQMSLITNFIF